MDILELEVNNFGPNLTCKIFSFNKESLNICPDPDIYQALHCLFNPKYIDYRVTKKYEDPGNNSYVQVKLNNPKFVIKRMLNSSESVYVGGGMITLIEWKQYLAGVHIITFEPTMTSADSFVKKLVVETLQTDNKMGNKLDELRMNILDVQSSTQEVTAVFKESFHLDYDLVNILTALTYFKMEQHHNHCETMWEEIKNLPSSKSVLNRVWNISVAMIQSSTAEILKENCSQAIKKISEKIQTNTEIFNNIQPSNEVARLDELLIRTQRNNRLRNQADDQIMFYMQDDSFVRKYFHKRNAEEIIINQKRDDEDHLALLEQKIVNIVLNRATNLSDIDDSKQNIQRLVHELNQLYEFEHNHMLRGFEAIQSKYLNDDCIYSSIQSLCEILNDAQLEYADINPIIGLLQALNLNEGRAPHCLFDEVNLDTNQKSGWLQCCLGPLSSVLYYDTTEEAISSQIKLMEEQPSEFDTHFVLAGLDHFQLNGNIQDEDGRRMSNSRTNIGYSKEMKNILSQLFVCGTGAVANENPNWIFNTDTNSLYADGQEMFPIETKHLFALLRSLKERHEVIRSKVSDSQELSDEIDSAIKAVCNNKIEIYRIESELRSEELNLRTMRFNLQNNDSLLSNMECLISRSKSRLINYEKLLCSQDENGPIDEVAFIQTASQQTTNILDLQDISSTDLINARLMFAGDASYPNNTSITNQMILLDSLNGLKEIWQHRIMVTVNANDVRREGDVRRRILDLVNVDFDRLCYLSEERKRLNRIRTDYGQTITFVKRQNISNIDLLIDYVTRNLNYPKAKLRSSQMYHHQFQQVVPAQDNAIEKAIQLLFNNQAQNEEIMARHMLEICNGLTILMKRIRNSNTVNVRGELLNINLDNIDGSSHMIGHMFALQNIHFQLVDNNVDIQHHKTDDIYLAIGFYIYMAYFYTRNVIVLHDSLKMLSQEEKTKFYLQQNMLSLKRSIIYCTNNVNGQSE